MLFRPAQDRQIDAASLPLVMLPGTLCDARVFAPLLAHLDVTSTVVPLSGATTTAAMAEAVLAQSGPRVSLLGFSLGAIVALEIVARAPERVARLALIGCNPGVLDAPAQRERARISRADFIRRHVPPAAQVMAAATGEADWQAQTAMTLTRQNSIPRLGRVGVPTLVLCGADDDICPPSMSRSIAAAIPGARLAIIGGAGHYATLDQPQAVAQELAAWLATPLDAVRKEPK